MEFKRGLTTKEQPAKANCSVLQGGTRRKDYHGIYSIDGILSFIQEGRNMLSNFNGEKLTELRHLFGMTQGQAAELLDVDTYKLIEIERSKINPTFNQIQILCRTFNVKSKYFYENSFLTNVVNQNYISLRR